MRRVNIDRAQFAMYPGEVLDQAADDILGQISDISSRSSSRSLDMGEGLARNIAGIFRKF